MHISNDESDVEKSTWLAIILNSNKPININYLQSIMSIKFVTKPFLYISICCNIVKIHFNIVMFIQLDLANSLKIISRCQTKQFWIWLTNIKSDISNEKISATSHSSYQHDNLLPVRKRVTEWESSRERQRMCAVQ